MIDINLAIYFTNTWRSNLTLFNLSIQCLRPPYGVLYLAAKKNYVGSTSAARQLKALVDEGGVFGAHLVSELTDREVWKYFFK